MSASHDKPRFEIGLASRPFPGEPVSGDRSLTKFVSGGVLFAVIDGAGHGSEATAAACAAETVLINSSETCPAKLLSLCHEAIRDTRGAAISLVFLTDTSLNWAGVGNVEGALLHLNPQTECWKRETLLLRNGVVGYESLSPRAFNLTVVEGDLLILATDGIDPFFLEGISLEGSAQGIAEVILEKHGKETDDALVMVVRMGKSA